MYAGTYSIYINDSLSWKDHISYIGSKLSKSNAILSHASSVINKGNLGNLYCTQILPYLKYCVIVWGHTYGTHLLPLFLKQKKAIVNICDAKYKEHTSKLFYDMKLLTIHQIIKLQRGIFMYKAFYIKLPYNLQAYLVYERTNYEIKTRQSSSFRQHLCTDNNKTTLCFSYW